MLGGILCVTSTTKDLDSALNAYVSALNYRISETGRIDQAQALAWSAPNVAGRRFGILVPEGGESVSLRLIENPAAPYIPAHASGSSVLAILQGEGGEVRRMVTIPEGMPAIMVQERLAAVSLLTGPVPTLAEGSVLPDTYAFQRGESRTALVTRMQQAMARTLDKLWADRAPDTVARSKEEAVILASIV